MRKLGLIGALLTATLLVTLSPTAMPEAKADVDVYTTPGTHTVNGREWSTTCEPYSQTQRCRTEIKATVITQKGGRFVKTTGWTFNNLTYVASNRGLWAGNPLGGHAVVGGTAAWTADGRRWRTECDTATTGRNGCRSYIEARVIESAGSGYRWVTRWIFNNMVRFTTAPIDYPTAPPMSTAPSFLKGRRHLTLGNVVTQNMAGTKTKGTGRISNIELDPGGKLGTFRESYWSWSFDDAVESDYGRFRAPIPNRPTGCVAGSKEAADRRLIKVEALPGGTCDVRTARSFLQAPTVRYGTYEALQGNSIRLYWNNSPITETYRNVTPAGRTFSELTLTAASHPGAVNAVGFMFGSLRAPGAGRSLGTLVDAKAEGRAPTSATSMQWVQGLGSSQLVASKQTFRFWQYEKTGAGCIVTPAGTRARPGTGWHSYMCPVGSDGRMVWHHMVGQLVAEGNGLCTLGDTSGCVAAIPRTTSYTIPPGPVGTSIRGCRRSTTTTGWRRSWASRRASTRTRRARSHSCRCTRRSSGSRSVVVSGGAGYPRLHERDPARSDRARARVGDRAGSRRGIRARLRTARAGAAQETEASRPGRRAAALRRPPRPARPATGRGGARPGGLRAGLEASDRALHRVASLERPGR
ncbi:hypothetical protein G7085_10740 [Tessaracoccus sp. HDW20]|uniref:hypothetical protein n=1 Tax=Tessaracoccus coleopterorum TaxID=2714950 RepID=UPI0018D3C8BE|nr:hypothetical protein [Tessaracoccus coleopterorum]NHB84927.1 hypothetical protein [Tessaracoccus coleopterorum]